MRISVSAVAIAVGAVALALVGVALAILALTGALSGDDSESNGGGPGTQTPFIAPSPYTTEVALQKLDEAERMIRLPDPALIRQYGVSTEELQKRIDLILRGTSDTSGLDDARAALETDNRILAAEYIHNAVIEYVTPAFGSADLDSISEEELNEVDPNRIFVEDHSQGLLTTAVYKEAAIALIHLWYRVLPE